MEGLPSGTVTFLFTDIEGSTPLWDAHPSAMGGALARHDEILRAAIDAGGGYVFATGGDGFCVAFDRAETAVTAAMTAQQALMAEPWPEHVELRVRMGLHSGEADERDGNYFGPAVNRAARLMGAANGGQVVASADTTLLLDDDGVAVHDLGAVRLKGLIEPVRVMGLATPDVPWLDEALVSRQTSAGNLPRPQTDLVGDLVDLQQRIATLADNRLVTLTGSGGVGKTRAAIEIGWLVLDEFPDGAWLIELAPVADPALIEAAIGSGLGVQPQPEMTLVESIVDWCTGRRVLLIIDNCEHVLDPAISVIDAIVASCPTATVLATSREPLGVAGEYVVRIPSLEPVHGAELFRARAAAAGAVLTGTEDEGAAIEAICTRLDGIPLAIEIAAARTRSLAPAELLARLDDRFRLLRGGGRGGIERHQTLRATVAWSYQLLTDQQRLLFDRLSVFAGGFDLPTAEAICADDTLDELDIIDLLGELVDKSMVIADRAGSTTRYRLLETLRQYGEERLTDRDETAGLRDRHLAHHAALTRPMWARYPTAAQHEIDATLTTEWDNLRAAHNWAITTHDLDAAGDIVAGIHHHAWGRCRNDASLLIDQTIALADELGRANVGALTCGAIWAYRNLDVDRSLHLADRAWDLVEAGGPTVLQAAAARAARLEALTATGADTALAIDEARHAVATIDDPAARFFILDALIEAHTDRTALAYETEQLVAAAQHSASPLLISNAARLDGIRLAFWIDPPDVPGAIQCFRESAAMAASNGTRTVEGWALMALGLAAAITGQADVSMLQIDALRFANEIRHPRMIDVGLNWIAFHLISRSDLSNAAIILGYIEQRRPTQVTEAQSRAAFLTAVADLDDADALIARGAAMNRPEIVDHATTALEGLDPTGSWQPISYGF